MAGDRINWDYVHHRGEKDGYYAVWRPYGMPEIVDPYKSKFADVQVSPRWKVSEKVALRVAITGAFYSKRANPAQPVSVDEIRAAAEDSIGAGVSAVHIHVRDDDGFNVLDPERFSAVIDPLRASHPQAVFDGCLVATRQSEWDAMDVVLQRKTLDMVPVNTLAAFNGDSMFVKPPHVMIEKTKRIQDAGLKAEVAVYTDADVDNARRYVIASGLLERPYTWIILPALPGCSPMHNPRQMAHGLMRMVESIYDIDPDSRITVCAAGRASIYLTALAATLGLDVRVGMEDTVWKWPHRDDLIQSNLEQVTMARQLLSVLGRDVMTADEYRQHMGLA